MVLFAALPVPAQAEQSASRKSVEQSLNETRQSLIGGELPPLRAKAQEAFQILLYIGAAVLIAASLWKRSLERKRNSAPGGIEILAQKNLGPRTTLLVVEAEGQRFLLARSTDDITLVSQIDPPQPFEASFSKSLGVIEPEVAVTQGAR